MDLKNFFFLKAKLYPFLYEPYPRQTRKYFPAQLRDLLT